MIARKSPASAVNHQDFFLRMLPSIRRHARIAFRDFDPLSREDLIEEAVANAFVAYARLVELGKQDLAYAGPLAGYAVKQIKDGRRVGCKLNVRDVTSDYCRVRKGVRVEPLDRFDRERETWREVLVEDRHAGPAETAATRLDFAAWLRQLPRRTRKIAKTLATGETTTDAAKRFDISPARISQLRRELKDSWKAFAEEAPVPASL